MKKNIIKEYFENPSIKINYSLWNNHNYYIKDWSIDKNPIIIGVTGSYGKTSAIYALTQYLTSIGKRVCTYCSTFVQTYSGNYPTNVTSLPLDLNSLATFLWICSKDKPNYIIIECHDNNLLNGVFDKLQFDYKLLVNFKYGFNKHLKSADYLQVKKTFISNLPCPTLINADCDNLQDFIDCVENKENLKLFFQGSSYIYPEEAENKAADIYTKTNLEVITFPVFKLGEAGKSFFSCFTNKCFYNFETTLSMDTGIDICISLLGMLSLMNIFDDVMIERFIKETINIPGRCEDFQWAGRNIIIDSSSNSIEKIVKEITSSDYLAAIEYCKKNYPTYQPVENNFKNIRVVYGDSGVTLSVIDKYKADKNYVFINPISDSDKVCRHNFLTFGANLYCLIHKLDRLPEEGRYINLFNEIKEEIGTENILDHTKQAAFTKTYLKNLNKKLISTCLAFKGNTTLPDEFFENFAWRSVITLKELFRQNLNDFDLIAQYFNSLDNEELNNACTFIREKLVLVNELMQKPLHPFKDLPITKFYITFANGTDAGAEKVLADIAANIEQPSETFTNRYEALEKLIAESEEGDLMLVTGRGNTRAYSCGDDTFLYGTDKQLLKEIITKNEKTFIK